MGLINGNNSPIYIGSSSSSVLPDYYDNLKTVLNEKFTTANSDFTLTNSSVSSNGLAMSSFGSALYSKNTKMVYIQAQARFVYSSAIVFGLYVNGCFACVDTSNKTFKVYYNYDGGSTMPSSTLGTESITDDFVNGDEYTITMDCKGPKTMVATFRNLTTGNDVTVTSAFSPSRTSKDCGVMLFSGSTTVKQLLFRVPLYNHAKAIFVGDSTTWNSGLSNYEQDSWAYIVMDDYFYLDGLISARGGDNIPGGIATITTLFDMGWTFDYVIMALGTNVSWPLAVNHTYAAQIAAQRTQFANFNTLCNQHGGILLWCAPPSNSNDDLTESLEEAEADNTTLGHPSRTILRKLIIDVFGDHCIRFDLATMTNGAYDSQYFLDGLHPNALGNHRESEFAIAQLMELNYH